MSAETLQAALGATGVVVRVEARARLAIISADDVDSSRAVAARRDSVVALAAAHGFSHVALEIGPPAGSHHSARGDAALPGD